ncbi:DUF6531 domain-containing protein [Streptomyces sp. NPDC003032]
MAGNRPRDWHVLDLDKDPTPGDPDRVRKLAKDLHDFSDDVGKVLRDIKGMAGEEAILQWAGKTAEAFTEKFEDAPSKLKKLKKSYGMAGDALAAYWPELERAQSLADKALIKGREAQADLSSAKSRLSSADSWVEKAGKEADKYKDEGGKGSGGGKDVPKPDPDKVRAATRNATSAESAQKSAKSDVTSAQNALDAAKKMAEDARRMREEAAGTAKRKIDEASDAGIRNRKWWEEIGDWVSDNWDTIIAVCKVVVAVVGIIAMIVGGPILAAIVIVAGVIVLADTLNKYRKGQAGLLDVAFAALDCVPGMKGLTTAAKLGKGLKGLKGGLKGFKSARTALKDGAKGAYNRVKSKIKGCGDPVDVATGQMFLDATDVTLPGTLPLVFTRRVASGYRSGGWFGPTWTSTLDQRLEVDEDGVVFVTEDGMLLAYPHPEGPDAPVLPDGGPRWPLERLDDGGYRLTDPLTGHTRHFTPPDPDDGVALLARVSDRHHNTIDFDYEADGAPVAIRHCGGYHLKLTVEDDRVTALALADDGTDITIKRYGYTDGDLTTVTNSSGRSLTFTYDHDRRITSWLDTNQSLYNYAYDSRGRCVSQSGESGYLANTFSYDCADQEFADQRITTVTDADGAEARYVIDSSCLVVCEIDPLGNRVHTAYDEFHHVASRTDALTNTTQFVHNEHGQPLRVRRPDDAVTQLEYNELCRPVRVTLPDGNSWIRKYDARGNCLEVIDPTGSVTRYAFDESGGPTSVTDPLGATTYIRSNAAGLPLQIVDPLGNSITYEYNSFGRPVVSIDATGGRTEQSWTIEGRISRRTAPDGSVEAWSYDGEGNCLSYTDPAGAVTHYEYSHFDVLTARLEPGGMRHEFTYDSALRLIEVRNPLGRTWRYQYDPAGRLTSEIDFDGREIRYDHDAAGRLISRTNPLGQQIRYERDALGQMVRKEAEAEVSTYSYDVLGNLTEASNPHSSVHLRRDSKGALVAETVNGRTVTYEYDAVGRRTRRVTPSGAIGEWSYDAVGNRTSLTSSARTMGFQHDSQGREVSRTTDASVAVNNAYDLLGRLTDQTVTARDGHTVQRRSYAYRTDGYPTSIDDRLNGAVRFSHDSAGRILTADAESWSERYAYDDAGNLLSADWPPTHAGREAVGTRSYEGTAILRAGRVRYEYDRAGRITLRQKKRMSHRPDTWHYTWDAEDRLTCAITPDGTEWRYRYDPFGRRIAKERLTEGHVTESTAFTWEGTTLCEQTTRSQQLGNQITLTWDHVGLLPVAQTESRTALEAPQAEVDQRFFTIVSDLVGTPTELLDETGEIAWRARRTVWGVTTWNSDATTYTPLRHPGQYFDPETELHYNCFRYYDPQTARYLTLDPLGLTPAPNPVTFVHNPHALSDPLGLAPCREFFTVQSPADAARLRGGGEPWPSSMHRAHFGEGVYSWASRSDAERYFAIKSKRTDELEMVRFTIPEAEFAKLRKADISKMTDDEADAFIDRYSLMSDTGKTDHGYQYITRPTNLGSEHFFDKSVMHLLKFD